MSKETGRVVKCGFCGRSVYKSRWIINNRKNLFCSTDCKKKFMIGNSPWNKGKKGLQVAWNKGIAGLSMEKHPMWKGGLVGGVQGYLRKRIKGCYQFEHRFIMEKHLGRELKPTEIVHHIDFDRKNNNINNLMLFSSNSEHLKYHQWLKKFS